jgi:hypothetical protein
MKTVNIFFIIRKESGYLTSQKQCLFLFSFFIVLSERAEVY